MVVLVDNYCDELLADQPGATRFSAPSPKAVMGEPGLSMLVTVFKDKVSHTLLLDGGMSGICLMHNLDLLPECRTRPVGRPGDVAAIVLSHGHSDHFKGIEAFLAAQSRRIPLFLHPFAKRRRRYCPDHPPGHPMAGPDIRALEDAGAVVTERSGPSVIAGGLVLVSGRVDRVTGFETGTPGLEARIDGTWQPDPFHDDQAIAVHLKGLGLVVLSGCSHAGIINMVEHVMALCGTRDLHGVMGGFHLPGPGDAPRTRRTIGEMKKLSPDHIIPMHCTGWAGIQAFAAAMPGQFILNSVGTTYTFGRIGQPKPEAPPV